jgi:hypothetical protein
MRWYKAEHRVIGCASPFAYEAVEAMSSLSLPRPVAWHQRSKQAAFSLRKFFTNHASQKPLCTFSQRSTEFLRLRHQIQIEILWPASKFHKVLHIRSSVPHPWPFQRAPNMKFSLALRPSNYKNITHQNQNYGELHSTTNLTSSSRLYSYPQATNYVQSLRQSSSNASPSHGLLGVFWLLSPPRLL